MVSFSDGQTSLFPMHLHGLDVVVVGGEEATSNGAVVPSAEHPFR